MIHNHQEELNVGTQLDGETDTALLLWPLIISHKYWRNDQNVDQQIKHLLLDQDRRRQPVVAYWTPGPAKAKVRDHLDPGGDHWGNREHNSGQDFLSFRWDPLGPEVCHLFLNNNHAWFPRFKNIMSYVENQGVYAVNCASLDEVWKSILSQSQ